MIETWIGEDKFRDGMRIYMAAHKYNNSTSADLWAALSQAANRDVGKVAAGFTEQPGIPLIHVARACEKGHAQIALTQDRFTINDPHPKALSWIIPVTYGAPGTAPQQLLLSSDPQTITLAKCNSPVKLNFGETGYYRTQYDAASLKALQAIMPKLDATDRVNLLGDQFALFVANRAPLSDYLALLPALKSEHSIAVWQDTLDHLKHLTDILQGSDQEAGFNKYAVSLVRPQLARLGWDAKPNESFLDTVLRPQLIEALGQFNDPQTIAAANKRFAAFIKDSASLPPAQRDPVFNIVGHHADQATYDTLKKLGTEAVSTEEKLRYFEAMGTAADPALMQQSVAFATSGAIPNGRILSIIQSASRNSGNPELLFKLVLQHEADFAARIPADGFGITAPMVAVIGSSNPDTAKAMLALKSSTASIGAKTWAARIAGAINTAAELRSRTVPVVKEWLASKH